jgi:hypothetical protein
MHSREEVVRETYDSYSTQSHSHAGHALISAHTHQGAGTNGTGAINGSLANGSSVDVRLVDRSRGDALVVSFAPSAAETRSSVAALEAETLEAVRWKETRRLVQSGAWHCI